MILQKCVVCKKDVDVDNCFGAISKDETFCDDHENIRLALREFEIVCQEVSTLKIRCDKSYEKIQDLLRK